MTDGKLNAVIVGCGNIAAAYANQIAGYDSVDLVGFSDIDVERAEGFASEHGGRVYPTLDDVLADETVDIVVNLTIHHAHVDVITRCLEGGKHVHTEKPFAMDGADALALVALAETNGLRLSSAPITFMGEAQQTAWKLIREGRCGDVRLVYSEINHGRIETWHPNPEPFYDVGVLWDVGVYPITLMTTMLGRVSRVTGQGRIVAPDRVTKEGRAFRLTTPDYVQALLEFESGTVARLTANFYVGGGKQRGGLEFHGDDGSVYLGCFQGFNAPVEFAGYREDYVPVELVGDPFEGTEFGRGVEDLAEAILEDRPHRAQGAHAAHVIEVIAGILASSERGEAIEIESTFTPPSPMPWASQPE